MNSFYIQIQKGTVSSNSFSYERKPLNRQHDTIFENQATTSQQNSSKFQSPIKSRLTVNPSDDNNSVTLTHTVSFYRRQQTQNSPSVRKGIHHPQQILYEPSTTDENTDDEKCTPETKNIQSEESKTLVDQKIRQLLNHVNIQQQQIAQASNALNTCASTFEFSGSTESVVAEWKLLVASK